MSDRNLNPHAEARVAMALWSDRYSKQNGGCMDFYDGLTASEKVTCSRLVDEIRNLPRKALEPLSIGEDG